MAVEIGKEAIDRPDLGTQDRTYLNKQAPAIGKGVVTSIDIWPNSPLTACKIGIFYLISGSTYKCRSSVNLGAVSAGFQNISGLSLAVEVGDLIGIYSSTGQIERTLEGEDGLFWAVGDYCDVGDEYAFSTVAGAAISLGGYISLDITIQPMTNVLVRSAQAHGTIISLGVTGSVTQHGHCWATAPNPTTADSKTELGTKDTLGAFASSLTDLVPHIPYYVRAYATDDPSGTVYSSRQVIFTPSTEILRPNAPGDKCGTEHEVGDACPDHWKNVDDIYFPDEYTTRVYGEDGYPRTDLVLDLYNLENHTAGLGDITNVAVYARVIADTADYPCICIGIKTNGVEDVPPRFNPGTSWVDSKVDYPINPVTGNPWTWAEIDALQIGIGLMNPRRPLSGHLDKESHCTQMWAEVVYEAVVAPTVTADPVTEVEEETAIGNGEITDNGGEDCDKRGICWNTTGNPTVDDNKSEETDPFGTGAFSRPITGLSPGTKYYVKAYAHNSAGYGYGSEESFTTKPNAPSNLACVVQSSSQIDVNWIKGTGATKTMVRRKVGSYPSNVTDGDQAYYGTGNSFNDTGLDPGKHYYYRAWSWVEGGDIWSDDYAEDNAWTLIGVPAVTTDEATGLAPALATLNGTLNQDGGEACECGFEWGLDTNYGVITPTETKTTGKTFSQVIGGLIPNTVYHFRAFATNSAGTGHGADRTFTTALVISRAYALARAEL